MFGAFALWAIACSSASADGTTQAPNEATQAWQAWNEAQQLFQAGRYEDALQKFRAYPKESATYFYNLGTVYEKLGQPGQALAYLSKANHLSPHDSDIQHNLQLAQAALGRLVGKDRLDPASSGLEAMADRVSMGEVRGALGLLGLIIAILWLKTYLKTRNLKRTLLQPSGFFGLIGLGITLGLYTTERLAEAHPPAFAIERTVIRSGPGDQFNQLAQLEAGIKIRLLGPSEDGWSQVRYSNDGIGWVRVSSLLLF